MSKRRASTFISLTFPARLARLVPFGVERMGGGREGGAEVAAIRVGGAEFSQGLGGGVGRAGLRVQPFAQRHVAIETIRIERANLEVHRGVVDAAQLRAATDEG